MDDPSLIRFYFFIGGFCLFACWETFWPRKRLTQNRLVRWVNNLGLIGFNSICATLLMPIIAFQAAGIAAEQQIGLFNQIGLPYEISVIACVILLDLAIYLQHLLFHRFPLLWRLHKVHHADQDIDVTTAARFHPIEIILSLWIKIGVIFALGVPAFAVLIFEVVLNVSAMFNHSNGRMPLALDRLLRKLVVTPDMHRVHHSVILRETHSNFGFFLSVWDQIFATYRPQPEKGHHGCTIGIEQFREPREQYLDRMLSQPFR